MDDNKNKVSTPASGKETSEANPAPSVDVDAATLIKAYKENELGTDKQYKGKSLKNTSKKYFKKEPIIVSTDINTGIKVPAPYSSKLGSDRIVDIVGAKVSSYLPAIVVDFGTATTFDCVDGDMNYRGGIICPGMNISAEALYARAAKLPRVEIEAVSTSLGMDTTTQMQAGLFYGFLGQFENIIKHLKEELDGEYKVVLTGGLSKFIGKHSEYVDVVDEELTLKGIIELYKMNKEK